MPLRHSCREVTRLVTAREDRALTPSEKLALEAHMVVCQACQRFERQVELMRVAMRRWKNYGGDNDGDSRP